MDLFAALLYDLNSSMSSSCLTLSRDASCGARRRTEGFDCLVRRKGKKTPFHLRRKPKPNQNKKQPTNNQDVVTRFASATGHHVPRRFGWDCHGLPIEHEIDKALGIKTKAQVVGDEKGIPGIGIPAYNDACRAIVMKHSGDWRKTVRRAGRWIDFDNDYKTLDTDFMESVWWVFSQLFAKNLVYRGFKVMPYSTDLKTALSNFEVANTHRNETDPAVMVSFPLDVKEGEEEEEEEKDGENGSGNGAPGSDANVDRRPALVAWTTTPWTLPSNLALCVHPEFIYVKVRQRSTGKVFIVAEARLGALPGAGGKKKGGEGGGGGGEGGGEGGGGSKKKDKRKKKEGGEPAAAATAAPEAASAISPASAAPAPGPAEKKEEEDGEEEQQGGYEILATMKGSALAGRSYEPLFPFFASLKKKKGSDSSSPLKGAFRILADTYVTADSGTGVVHQAPAFGEDDMRVCLAHGVISRDGGSGNGNGGDSASSASSLPLGSMPCPVDENGNFTLAVGPTLAGKHVKDKEADKEILAAVKASGRLVDSGTITHSVAHCPRSDKPLIHKAVPSWFVRVEEIREKLLSANAQTRWVPQYVKEKRCVSFF